MLVIRDIALEREVATQSLRHRKLESLGLLAGGIAHDFNNILAGLLGSISVARSEARRITTWTRCSSNGPACHAPGVADSTAPHVRRRSAPSRTIGVHPIGTRGRRVGSVRVRIAASMTADRCLARVSADEGQFAQVINNVVINANQAMPKGRQVAITLATSK